MSLKVIEVDTNRKPVCDFLRVINSNWHPDTPEPHSGRGWPPPAPNTHPGLWPGACAPVLGPKPRSPSTFQPWLRPWWWVYIIIV